MKYLYLFYSLLYPPNRHDVWHIGDSWSILVEWTEYIIAQHSQEGLERMWKWIGHSLCLQGIHSLMQGINSSTTEQDERTQKERQSSVWTPKMNIWGKTILDLAYLFITTTITTTTEILLSIYTIRPIWISFFLCPYSTRFISWLSFRPWLCYKRCKVRNVSTADFQKCTFAAENRTSTQKRSHQ